MPVLFGPNSLQDRQHYQSAGLGGLRRPPSFRRLAVLSNRLLNQSVTRTTPVLAQGRQVVGLLWRPAHSPLREERPTPSIPYRHRRPSETARPVLRCNAQRCVLAIRAIHFQISRCENWITRIRAQRARPGDDGWRKEKVTSNRPPKAPSARLSGSSSRRLCPEKRRAEAARRRGAN